MLPAPHRPTGFQAGSRRHRAGQVVRYTALAVVAADGRALGPAGAVVAVEELAAPHRGRHVGELALVVVDFG